jgi:hypothetical protein
MKFIAVTLNADDGVCEILIVVFGVVGDDPQFPQPVKPKHPKGSGQIDAVKKLEFDRVDCEVEDDAMKIWTEAAQEGRGDIS